MCHRGHPLTGDNVSLSYNRKRSQYPRRECITCRRLRQKAGEMRKRARASRLRCDDWHACEPALARSRGE